nr:MAG: hypothetical protein [Sesarmops intermedium nimavirus]
MNSCDRPDEYLDVETLDVVPALTTPEDDDPDDELDDGPGTHRWPAKLSCGFVCKIRCLWIVSYVLR